MTNVKKSDMSLYLRKRENIVKNTIILLRNFPGLRDALGSELNKVPGRKEGTRYCVSARMTNRLPWLGLQVCSVRGHEGTFLNLCGACASGRSWCSGDRREAELSPTLSNSRGPQVRSLLPS
jgi:hypothetical protein